MSRAAAIARRADLERQSAPDAILAFLTIEHPALADPIRVVSDVIDYEVDGDLYRGLPFGFRLVPDADDIPRAQLTVENVDSRIADAVLAMNERATVALALRSSADFDLSRHPRVALGAAAPIYAFSHLSLRDVQGSATEISGTVMLHDYSTEPWPSVRAIEARTPGLFW